MSAPLTGERLAEIAAREAAATAGPWMADGAEIYRAPWGDVVIDQWVGETLRIDDRGGSNADAAFIAHTRTDVPALLAEVERLKGEFDALDGLDPELTVFRASYLEDGITLGTYRSRQAAMDHVHHGLAREENTTPQAIELRVIWRADDPEADEPEWECWLFDEDGADDKATGYVVGPVTVASEYDPDGDE